MNPIRQFQYDEYYVAENISKLLKKKNGYSVNLPISCQQKGFDLLVHSSPSGKSARIQIKGSKRWKGISRDQNGRMRDHRFWFKCFSCLKGAADFYCLVGFYPVKVHRIRPNSKVQWNTKILVIPEREMAELLERVRTNSGEKGHSFYLEFNEGEDDIFLTRGVAHGSPLSLKNFLIEEDETINRLTDFLN